jgi:hypothetical protein
MTMTTLEAVRGITGGVDTHRDVHVAAALDPLGGVLGGTLSGRAVGDLWAYRLRHACMHAWQSMIQTDSTRPLVEFYRRHDEVELWVPVPMA